MRVGHLELLVNRPESCNLAARAQDSSGSIAMAGGSEDFFKAFRWFHLGACPSKWYIAHITALEKN